MKNIILTHGHADHIGGISLWKEDGTQIIAQRNYVEFVNYVIGLRASSRRNARCVREEAEAGQVRGRGTYGAKTDPTILFDENTNYAGGIKFQLFSTPGETPDHLTIWIPTHRGSLHWRQLLWHWNS